ncbi:formyltransferase family protein [Streptomyces sp. NPDC001714]|uniref:formyltransferase family protein n=1 Tax=Streptomyces sp. NPDC001714 TaxID=3364603 RepID=UPI0036C52960
MTPVSTPALTGAALLLRDFSLEMTGKDTPKLEAAGESVPEGTRVNVTYLGNEDLPMRRSAARSARRLGFVPVPHVSARRLGSQRDLEEFLAALRADGTERHVFVVGGDPAHPHGPYGDSLSVIRSGLLQKYGVRQAGISGYPEGHPHIPEAALWAALEQKAAALAEEGLPGDVITQFGFDPEAVLGWIERLRERGIDLPVRVGVPGPAGVRRLLSYATRFGVGTSASIARKYGLSLTNLVGTAGKRLAKDFDLDFTLRDLSVPKRVAVFASRSDHCLLDLLWRHRRGELPVSVAMVISNHPDTAEEVRGFGVPFFHVPSMGPDKSAAEAEHLRLLEDNVDFVVLARYMQILSGDFAERVGVPIINIHHSFLFA